MAVHHSGVRADSSSQEIAAYHAQPHGPNREVWPGIGYHFVVRQDGQIEYAGDLLTSRANVWRRNREVIGICLPGDYTDDWPPTLQIASTLELTQYLRDLLPGVQVVGHRDIALPASPSRCPGDTWEDWREAVTG